MKRLKKTGLVLVCIALSISLFSCSGKDVEQVGNSIANAINHISESGGRTQAFSEYRGHVTFAARLALRGAGIEYWDQENGRIIPQPIEEYKKIKNLDEEELYGYYIVLDEEESEKIVQLLGYEGWDDYLIQHNYLDENQNPSIEAWEGYLEAKSYERYMEL